MLGGPDLPGPTRTDSKCPSCLECCSSCLALLASAETSILESILAIDYALIWPKRNAKEPSFFAYFRKGFRVSRSMYQDAAGAAQERGDKQDQLTEADGLDVKKKIRISIQARPASSSVMIRATCHLLLFFCYARNQEHAWVPERKIVCRHYRYKARDNYFYICLQVRISDASPCQNAHRSVNSFVTCSMTMSPGWRRIRGLPLLPLT